MFCQSFLRTQISCILLERWPYVNKDDTTDYFEKTCTGSEIEFLVQICPKKPHTKNLHMICSWNIILKFQKIFWNNDIDSFKSIYTLIAVSRHMDQEVIYIFTVGLYVSHINSFWKYFLFHKHFMKCICLYIPERNGDNQCQKNWMKILGKSEVFYVL